MAGPTTAWSEQIPTDVRLDRLFGELKQAENELEARRLAAQIDSLWRSASGETAELLLSRADEAIADEDFALNRFSEYFMEKV